MYTNQMRMTGLSGIDTDSMVKQLMQAESVKYNRLLQQKQLSQWKQASYLSVSSSLLTFQTQYLNFATNTANNLRSVANFSTYNTSIKLNGTDSTAVTIKPGSSASSKDGKLEVYSIAKKDIYQSVDTFETTFKADEEFDLSSFSSMDDTVTKTIKVRLDNGDTKDISFTGAELKGYADDDAFLADLNAKLASKFGTETGVNKVSADLSGGKLSFSTTSGHTAYITGSENDLTSFGFSSGGNTAMDLNKKLKDVFSADFFAGGDVDITINRKPFTITEDTTLKDLMKEINETPNIDAVIKFDSFSSKFTLESTKTGTVNGLSLGEDAGSQSFFAELGFVKENGELNQTSTASDARVKLNGVMTTRETNAFTLDNIAITLTDEAAPATEDVPKVFEFKSTRDYKPTMELIKTFVSEYNKLIEMLNNHVNTPRPRSSSYSYYEPLTEDEKSAMSDKDIEKWEEKAQTGMLYRDDTIRSIQTQLRTMMYETVDMGDGTKLGLFNIGITTTNKVQDGGKLQINETELQKALEEHGDKVMTLFTKGSDISSYDKSQRNARLKSEGIAERLNDIINWTSGSSGTLTAKAGSPNSIIDNDMSKKIKDQDEKISAMLKALASKETYYYTMFSKLESAMNQSNNQMSSLQSMLGL